MTEAVQCCLFASQPHSQDMCSIKQSGWGTHAKGDGAFRSKHSLWDQDVMGRWRSP